LSNFAAFLTSSRDAHTDTQCSTSSLVVMVPPMCSKANLKTMRVLQVASFLSNGFRRWTVAAFGLSRIHVDSGPSLDSRREAHRPRRDADALSGMEWNGIPACYCRLNAVHTVNMSKSSAIQIEVNRCDATRKRKIDALCDVNVRNSDVGMNTSRRDQRREEMDHVGRV
jgi:hypothetical protein